MRHRTLSTVAFVVALLLGIGGIGAVSPVSAQDDSVTVELEAEDDSGVTGQAVLTADGDQTLLTVELEGSEEGYEGHVFDSNCGDHQSATVFYAIEAVDADGQSESTVDAPLSELTTGDFWVHMHQPAGERGVGVACGQVLAAEDGEVPAEDNSEESDEDGVGGTLPTAGVGSLTDNGSNAWLIAGLVAALAAFGGSVALRGRKFN